MCIYIYIYVHMYTHTYTKTHTQSGNAERAAPSAPASWHTVLQRDNNNRSNAIYIYIYIYIHTSRHSIQYRLFLLLFSRMAFFYRMISIPALIGQTIRLPPHGCVWRNKLSLECRPLAGALPLSLTWVALLV